MISVVASSPSYSLSSPPFLRRFRSRFSVLIRLQSRSFGGVRNTTLLIKIKYKNKQQTNNKQSKKQNKNKNKKKKNRCYGKIELIGNSTFWNSPWLWNLCSSNHFFQFVVIRSSCVRKSQLQLRAKHDYNKFNCHDTYERRENKSGLLRGASNGTRTPKKRLGKATTHRAL